MWNLYAECIYEASIQNLHDKPFCETFMRNLYLWNWETFKNGTFKWNLGDPELVRAQPSCGTFKNLNLYVELGNFSEWNLNVEPWET